MADYVIPDGWHTPKLKLERISGYFPVEDYGLPYDAQALLRSKSMDKYPIMCGGEYNDISDFVTRIVEPRENGRKNIKTKLLHYVKPLEPLLTGTCK